MSILVIGSLGIDTIENPFGRAENILGGSASYTSLAASYFDQEVNLLSIIGNDFPNTFLQLFQKRGIRTTYLQRSNSLPTLAWKSHYKLDMRSRDTVKLELNALSKFDPKLPLDCKKMQFIAIGSFMPRVQLDVIQQLNTCAKLIVLDTMSYWIKNCREDLMKVIPLVDVLSIKETEARLLTNEFSLAKAAQAILDYGPKYLIINKGENGVLLFHKKQVFFAPSLPLALSFDPTGMCDSFIGGFIGHLSKTDDISFENMKRAVIYGSAVSSLGMEQFGTEQLENLTKNQIEHRVQEFIDLVQFEINLDE